MRIEVTYKYDREAGSWYVESDLPGYFVVASTLDEVRRLVHEGLPFFLEGVEFDLVENGPDVYSLISTSNAGNVSFHTSEAPDTGVPHRAPVG